MEKITDIKMNPARARSMEKIITALFDLMLSTPLERISVTDICEKAGVARRTFYKIFDSKEGVVAGKLELMFLELTTKFDFNEVTPNKVLQYCFDYLDKDRKFASAFKDELFCKIAIGIVKQYVEVAFDSTLHDTVSFEPVKADMCYAFIAVGIVTIISMWAKSSFKQPANEMSALTRRLLTGVFH